MTTIISSDMNNIDVKSTETSTFNKLSTWQIVLLIVASAAPLGSIMGNVPIGFILGNGPGLPAAYLIAGFVLLCFAIGYSTLVVEIPGEGAFYLYIREVFGVRIGMGAAFVALLSYTALTVSIAGGLGYFTDLIFSSLGLSLGWEIWAAIGYVIVTMLGRLSADIGAKVLVFIISSEFLILLGLDVSSVAQAKTTIFPISSFDSQHVFGNGVGVALMIGFLSFIGLESAALYTSEAKDPKRSIPRATIIAVVLISLFYFVTSWIIVGTLGVDNVVDAANELQGELIGSVIFQQCGELVALFAAVMLCASIFACYLALQNAAARYVLVISQQGCLPKYFSVISSENGAPARASTLISVVIGVCLLIPALAGLSPYLVLGPSAAALATLGIIVLQAFVALATLKYFRKKQDSRWISTLLAPAIATLGLIFADILIINNYNILTGVEAGLSNYMPWLLVVAFVYGLCQKSPSKMSNNLKSIS